MMDKYHSIHGQDEASFDLTATHRLPTVSAADALEDLDDATSRYVSTGLPDLDEALGSASAACDDHHRSTAASKRAGGIPRGQVAEIWGPPGVGKTALGPTATTLPKDTAVVVVSSLSTLVNHAFPKSSENRPGPQLGKGPSLAARRLQTLQHIVSALQKLAATRNCAVVVLTQCATKMQAESGATLVPAINANVWEQGVSTRLVVFKDWAWKDGRPSTAGLIALQYDASQPSVVLTSTPRRKRKLDDAGLEVPDSDEGEGDYGWEVDDDAAAPVPPQTQGSEDLLLGVNHGLYNEDDGESDDDEAGGDRVVLDSEDDGGLVNDRDSGDGPTATTLPKDTAVVVVSSLSTLVNHAFPKSSEHRPGPQLGKGPSLAARRLQTLQHVVSALQKLAATRNCAAVVLTQCATKMQAESGATLVPAINANVWEQGVSTRLVVFKDWAWKDGRPSTVCLAGVQKLEGRAGSEAVSSAAAFRIEAAGLIALEYDASQPSVVLTSTPRRKRKIDDAGLEVPDSDEGEGDYGWEVDDDAAAPVPPQTQGSEDLLLGVNHGLYDEDDGENDDDEAGGDRVVQDSEDDGGLVNDRDSGDGSEAEDELGPGPRQQGGLDGASAGPDSLNSGTDRR
ncbi:hypothetical protein BN1708_006056 [Verticillium longisporum]|uniref:RecA family profile 1 domain-containing protein n=1 Tax=Verticillium longisporum TaxID=100787 RepID=A0A0G4MH51_VERLO|nr:hypothetical protein BN1708_006056 [Verticillium longisporum]